jgi:hypothetical protein
MLAELAVEALFWVIEAMIEGFCDLLTLSRDDHRGTGL